MSTAWSLEPSALSRPIEWKRIVSLLATPLRWLAAVVHVVAGAFRRRPNPRLTDLGRLNPHLLADIGYERSAPLAQATRRFWHR